MPKNSILEDGSTRESLPSTSSFSLLKIVSILIPPCLSQESIAHTWKHVAYLSTLSLPHSKEVIVASYPDWLYQTDNWGLCLVNLEI